jgi:large conductance mechanosensitive channel
MKKISKDDLKNLSGKGKGLMSEFKAFVLRGNVMDMAIGVIIGAAFSDIVTSLTKNFINPLINSIGGVEVGGAIKLPWVDYTGLTAEQVKELSLNYGDFITAVINFIIMAFVLFLMLKFVNKLLTIGQKKQEEEEKKEEAKAEKPADIKLLEEIRDELAKQNKKSSK